MNPCPHGVAAWKCAYYVHYIYSGKLCQNKERDKLTDKEDTEFCGLSAQQCQGYEIDKRFKGLQE